MRERILFVIPNLAGGGAERVVAMLSEALEPYYEVHIAVFDAEATYPHGGVLHNLRVPPLTGGARSALQFLSIAALRLRKLKRQLAPRVCISFLSLANFTNILAISSSPVIISIRTTLSRAVPATGNGRFARLLIRTLYPRANQVIAISRGVRADVVRHFSVPEEKVDVIYNPLPSDYLQSIPSEAMPAEFRDCFAAPVIVAVGRMVWQKGHARLLRIFAALKTDHPSAKLLIVGKGPLRQKLIALAHSLNLSVWSAEDAADDLAGNADVILPGFVPNPMAFVRHASVFAFPSQCEGLGQSLLEALATGTPVMASDCVSGPRELLAPGTEVRVDLQELEFAAHGILAPTMEREWPSPGEPLSAAERRWVSGLSRLLGDAECRQRYGALGRVRAEQFAMVDIVRQWQAQIARHSR